MLQMKNWNYESTVLIKSTDNFDRDNEFIDIRLKVKSWQLTDAEKEVRVVYKKEWNSWDSLLPCQVYNVERNEEWTSFNVAFLGNLKANSTIRFGVLYGNKDATPLDLAINFAYKDLKEDTQIANDSYIVNLDKKTAQLKEIEYKYIRTGFLLPFTINGKDNTQPGPSVIFANEDKDGLVTPKRVETSNMDVEIVEEVKGAICYSKKWKCKLKDNSLTGVKNHPVVEGEVKFSGGNSNIYLKEKITFKEDTKVLGIELSTQKYTAETFSHFSFRPTTPEFKETELEEMGHILIDPKYSANIPDGLVCSNFLNSDIPWNSFINIARNKWYTATRFLLDLKIDKDAQYRSGFYLRKEKGKYSSFIAPVYVENKTEKDNIVIIPAGTVYETSYILHFSPFEEGVWGEKEDLVGKRLNSPLEISIHPKYYDNNEWEENEVFTFTGNRSKDYTKAGVR